MKEGPDIAGLAALIGDPARANMLTALMSGLALTAGELAREAAVTPPTATQHLRRMVEAGFLVMEAQGRSRYYRLADPEVAAAIEALMGLASRMGRLRTRPGPRDAAMRTARICYDHLAGSLGVRMHDAFVAQGLIVATDEGLGLSPAGRDRFTREGVDVAGLETRKRPVCRACLDWSERRHHLAGSLGAGLLRLMQARGWARRGETGRALSFSVSGLESFERFLAGGQPGSAGRITAEGPVRSA